MHIMGRSQVVNIVFTVVFCYTWVLCGRKCLNSTCNRDFPYKFTNLLASNIRRCFCNQMVTK